MRQAIAVVSLVACGCAGPSSVLVDEHESHGLIAALADARSGGDTERAEWVRRLSLERDGPSFRRALSELRASDRWILPHMPMLMKLDEGDPGAGIVLHTLWRAFPDDASSVSHSIMDALSDAVAFRVARELAGRGYAHLSGVESHLAKRCAGADPPRPWGVIFFWDIEDPKNEIRVVHVCSSGFAAESGLRAQDVLVEVDATPAPLESYPRVLSTLAERAAVPVVVRRGTELVRLELRRTEP